MNLFRNAIFACCAIALLSGCDRSDTLKTGEPAKDFRLDTLTHGRFYLNQYHGKVVVLLFWATWCNNCKQQMVDLKSFLDIPRSENLVLAAVCTDAENINDVKEIVKNLGIDYPVLLDRNANVSRLYKASLLPETVVIDQTQYITFIRQGYDTNIAKQLRTKVAALLASDEGIK